MTLHRFLVCSFVLAVLVLACSQSFGDNAVFSGDTRLDQKVTFDSEGDTIASVLDRLSASTSVAMTAGVDSKDWFVQDRKVIVHVSDMKLSDLMQHLSAILRFHWSKGAADGKPTYRLWQDKQELAEEESLRNAVDTAQAQESRDKRENAIADMVNLGSLTDADAGKLKAADPWRYVLATEPLGRDVADLMSNLPEARGAFVQGTEASFPVVELTPQMQDAVRRIALSYDSLTRSIGGTEDYSSLLEDFDRLQITINKTTPGSVSANQLMAKSILGRITIGSGADSFDIPLLDPSSAVGKALGRAIIRLKGGASKDQVGKQLEAEMTAAQKAAQPAQSVARDITSDPDLRAKLKLSEKDTTAILPFTLKPFAAKSKLNVVSDYFPGLVAMIGGGEKTVGEQLETIRRAYGANWTKSGNTVRFRDKDWFVKRTWAVPEVWMKYWSQRGEINNGLFFDDFVQIANLRDEQIDNTIMNDPALARRGAGEGARNRQILRFYASLTADQVKRMSETKLDASLLSDAQWIALKVALDTKGAAYAAVTKGTQIIGFTQSAKDVTEYVFAYYPGESEAPVTFKLTSGDVFKTSSEVVVPHNAPKAKADTPAPK